MSKPSRRKRARQDDAADQLPPMCSRCSRCGRPWLTDRMTPHKGDVLCQICEEEWQMARLQALDKIAEAEHLIQVERQNHAKLN